MAVPNFLVVGAAKAGTTALYQYLRQHPDVYMPTARKETFFLSGLRRQEFPGPGANYLGRTCADFEAYRALFEDAGTAPAVGEACVAYLYYHERTIPRILRFLGPAVRIVISLRDPADRAYSCYLHHVRDCLEPLPFAEALAAEPQRKADRWWWGFQYTDVGFYAGQVEAYLDAFGPERVHVLLYEDFTARPEETLREVYGFLEVAPDFVPDMSRRPNPSGVPKSRRWQEFVMRPHILKSLVRPFLPARWRRRVKDRLKSSHLVKTPLPLDVRRELVEVYRADILRLADLIGRDLSHWLR